MKLYFYGFEKRSGLLRLCGCIVLTGTLEIFLNLVFSKTSFQKLKD